MRRISFILAILGIFSLLLFLLFSPPYSLSGPSDLKNLTENQKVYTSGSVIKERTFGNAKILTLNNSLELICDCPSLLGKNITILGKVNKYNSQNRIEVLRIK